MPRTYACDHCGRADVTFGVVYPGRDMSKPPIHLCQAYQGTQIVPNCYHLVTELGEPLGARKQVQISEHDRHSPKVEGAEIRRTENRTGLVLNETAREAGEPLTPYGEVIQTEHPLTGESVPIEPQDFEISPAITDAEKGKGILDPYGATQKPLVDPSSAEAQAHLDELATEQARKIPTLPPSQQRASDLASPRVAPGDTASVPPWTDPYGEGPITTPSVSQTRNPVTNADSVPVQGSQTVQPGSGHVSPGDPNATKTPAQVAKEAQERSDAQERARLERNPATKARLESADTEKADKIDPVTAVAKPAPKTAAARKAPAKKAAPADQKES